MVKCLREFRSLRNMKVDPVSDAALVKSSFKRMVGLAALVLISSLTNLVS